jgi:hypothetical protein
MILTKTNPLKWMAIVLMGTLLSACQTMKLTSVDNRDDLRFTEWVSKDGSVAKSYYQIREIDGNWYEAERKNGVWGLSEMGRMDYQRSLSGDGGGGGGGGGGCGS